MMRLTVTLDLSPDDVSLAGVWPATDVGKLLDILRDRLNRGGTQPTKLLVKVEHFSGADDMGKPKPWAFKDGPEGWEQKWCENCGRMRVNVCNNGYHRCEKCDWCAELKRRISDEEVDDEK